LGFYVRLNLRAQVVSVKVLERPQKCQAPSLKLYFGWQAATRSTGKLSLSNAHTTFEIVKIEWRLPSARSEEKSPTHAHFFFACNKGIFNFIDVTGLKDT
jgi:hypothetical protein